MKMIPETLSIIDSVSATHIKHSLKTQYLVDISGHSFYELSCTLYANEESVNNDISEDSSIHCSNCFYSDCSFSIQISSCTSGCLLKKEKNTLSSTSTLPWVLEAK